MLDTWLNEQPNQCYWLVGSESYREAVKANNDLGFSDTKVLFTGGMFAKVMAFSPMLIPVRDDVLALPSDVLNKGIGLATNVSGDDVLEHLQSLLVSALDGEEVLFRFYDLHVLVPMLRDMESGEREQCLGNLTSLAVFNGEGVDSYDNHHAGNYELQKATWWKIQPQHLEHLYNVSNHARLLERYWWEKIPDVMAQLDNTLETITQFLEQGVEIYPSKDQAELFTLTKITNLTNTPLDKVTDNLLLDEDEIDFMNTIQG